MVPFWERAGFMVLVLRRCTSGVVAAQERRSEPAREVARAARHERAQDERERTVVHGVHGGVERTRQARSRP